MTDTIKLIGILQSSVTEATQQQIFQLLNQEQDDGTIPMQNLIRRAPEILAIAPDLVSQFIGNFGAANLVGRRLDDDNGFQW